jgi:hypothetical protein
MNRTGLIICAASAALTLYACASLAQETTAASGSQAIAIVGGSGSGGTTTIRNTPDANAPGIIPTAPCIAVYSAGVSVAGFGGALGGGVTDHICQGANLAAIAHQIGRQDVADVALEIALNLYVEATTPQRLPVSEGGFPP